MQLTEEFIRDCLRPIEDPDLGMSLVDMGLIYDIEITEGNNVNIKMTLSSPAWSLGSRIRGSARIRLIRRMNCSSSMANSWPRQTGESTPFSWA